MYKVPEGYFDNLNARLLSIPTPETERSNTKSLWELSSPIIALAASFALLLVGGTFILRTTTPNPSFEEMDFLEYAYSMIPNTEPYSALDYTLAESLAPSVSEDDIVNYLIETGVSMDLIGLVSEGD